MDFADLSKKELIFLKKKLRLLNSLKKSLGDRGLKEYYRIVYGEDICKIEYFESNGDTLERIQKQSAGIFKRLFGIDIQTSRIEFKKNQNLKGGIRAFHNDNMFDLSYSRFENLLSKGFKS